MPAANRRHPAPTPPTPEQIELERQAELRLETRRVRDAALMARVRGLCAALGPAMGAALVALGAFARALLAALEVT